MTVKGTKELLTGDTATLITRLLIIAALGWGGVNQKETMENTDYIVRSLTTLEVKQSAMEQRISRNEQLDGSDHSNLRIMVEENRKELQEFKDKFYSRTN